MSPRIRSHDLLFDPFAYCSHPHATVTASGEWVVVFNKTMRRDVILHPPEDPYFHNLMMRSSDGGRTWSTPSIVPDFNWFGMECAGVTGLSDGRLLLVQWQFKWHPLPAAKLHRHRDEFVFPAEFYAAMATTPDLDDFARPIQDPAQAFPWARGGGTTWVHISDDGGRSFCHSTRVDTAPYSGGFGIRGAVELSDGELLLLLNEVPRYRFVFAVRSRDGGRTWSMPSMVAAAEGLSFEEPACIRLADGRLITLFREGITRRLFRSFSDDGGHTWNTPVDTGIPDLPASLIELPDGRLVCVGGHRLPPYGIRITVSRDGGATWDTENAVVVRDDLPNKDLGYPSVLPRRDGSLFVIYYGRNRDGVTGLMASEVWL